MLQTLQLRVAPEIAGDDSRLRDAAARELRVDPSRICRVDLQRRSIDARQRRVMVNLSLAVHIDEVDTTVLRYSLPEYPDVSDGPQVIIVGAGPAGLFAALELIELGLKPVVLERGKDVDGRRRDMALISREGIVDPDSNYCFGEGGAGAFSDGKLYTRSTKRGPVDKVLAILHSHGASDDILIDAHPHIGTDRLPGIIKAIRGTIIDRGGEVHFGARVDNLILSSDGQTATGVTTADGREFHGPVILATGHSARDVYRLLRSLGVAMEPKGLAVGVRLEHPQQLIDRIMYHSPEGRGRWLPPAEYSVLTRVDGRAVYSFCMCPGGVIIPAASEPGQIVVNGMSPSNRGTRWANSGMVVEVLPDDCPDGSDNVLKMMHFQQEIERRFFEAAGSTQRAPAQRMTDFVAARFSAALPVSSYAPGLLSARLDKLLPPFIASRLSAALVQFGHRYRGFLTSEAALIGCETRTSAPVRIPRDPLSRAHINVAGLYPTGEGAGYAGGIVSAAIDGINTARAVAASRMH